MKKTNSMKLQFVSRSANEGFARTAVSGFLASLDPTVEELADIKTAVSEAVTNCIVHAYADRIGIVYIAADLYADGRVVIRIRDKGCGIPDVEKAMEPLFTTGGEDRAGLGFAVMIVGAVLNFRLLRCPDCGAWLGRYPGEHCRHCGAKIPWSEKK